MKAIRLPLLFLLWLGLVPFAAAQVPHQLLALLPDDFAVCVVMHDLRGNAARWEQSDWVKTLRQSPLGKSYLDTPEVRQFERWQSEMKKQFGLDWPTLRDDILGDTLVLSYTPGPKHKPDDERGLFLLQVREPARLVQLIDKLNKTQIKADKLTLISHEYKGNTYYRRVEGSKSQYYIVKDSLAVVASSEEILQKFLDRHAAPAKDNGWAKRFKRAGADTAFLTMCVNPRKLDASEIMSGKKKDDPLPGYWKALEAIFVSVSIRDEAEVRLSIQADVEGLPEWAKGAFIHTATPSSLWQRFPERSILTVAAKTEFAGLADALQLLVPEKDRKKLTADWQGGLGKFLPKDLLANIGPDWGLCVLPSKDAKQVPKMVFALAVKPGPKEAPVDQALLKAIDDLTQFLLPLYNQKNPGATIRVERVMQDNVEVKYLDSDKLILPGFQPAWALKDGFLLLATSPAAIAEFRLTDRKVETRKDTPILRVSSPELARLLEQRRDHILSGLTEKDAKKNLENVIDLLGLFDNVTLSLHGDAGQATWSLRVTPARK